MIGIICSLDVTFEAASNFLLPPPSWLEITENDRRPRNRMLWSCMSCQTLPNIGVLGRTGKANRRLNERTTDHVSSEYFFIWEWMSPQSRGIVGVKVTDYRPTYYRPYFRSKDLNKSVFDVFL